MTLLGRIAMFFPAVHLALSAAALVAFLCAPGIGALALSVFTVYLLPPFAFRLYSLRFPPRDGTWLLNRPARSDWWVAHQLQLSYAALPSLEALLRVIPGAYSAWLRLWGSRVGKRVHWTPNIDIIDRHMTDVGDDVVFGHRMTCTSHIITKKKNGNIVLTVRRVSFGSGVVIGAGARIGPGVRVPDNAIVPYDAEYRWRHAA